MVEGVGVDALVRPVEHTPLYKNDTKEIKNRPMETTVFMRKYAHIC